MNAIYYESWGGGGGGGGEDSNDMGRNVILIKGKMKISPNLQVGKILIHRLFPKAGTISSVYVAEFL